MHVSWKLAEVTEGKSATYREMYLATSLYQVPPRSTEAFAFAEAIYERLAAMYEEDPKSVVMCLFTLSRLRREALADHMHNDAAPLFDGPPPKEKADSDVEINLDE